MTNSDCHGADGADTSPTQRPRAAALATRPRASACAVSSDVCTQTPNTETTSLATSQIPDRLQDRGANIQVEDNLGADVFVKSDLDLRAEAVLTICSRSNSTDTACSNCNRKPGFQVCIDHDLERFTT